MYIRLKDIAQKGTWDPNHEEWLYGPYFSICENVRNTLIKLATKYPDAEYSFDDEGVTLDYIVYRVHSDGSLSTLRVVYIPIEDLLGLGI